MKAQDFDQKFDNGEDIIHLLDLLTAKRPNVEQAIVSINLPIWMIELIDREADRLSVTPQTIIQTSLASQFALHNSGSNGFSMLLAVCPRCGERSTSMHQNHGYFVRDLNLMPNRMT